MATAATFSPGDRIVGARSRSAWTLAKLVGHGGEGDVFSLRERAGALVKLYRRPVDAVLAAKLNHLIGRATPVLKSIAAWPEDTVLDRRGTTIGFLMPAVVGAAPLHVLISPRARRQVFQNTSLDLLTEVAINIAAAIDILHAESLVVGDINGKNILVAQDGRVALIDIDSIQVGDGRQFPCTVGVPDYTPPELQGRSLSHARRTPSSDLFGLAVIVFQLLGLGRHPFDGSRLDRATAIKRHVHAFGPLGLRSRPLAPVGIRVEHILDASLMALFERAFALRSRLIARPSAADWADALKDYQTNLTTCRQNTLHHFPHTQTKCPWCALERLGKPAMFGPTSFRYTHWRDHYDAMMRLIFGRYAPLVIPDTYDPILRLLPRRVWMGLGIGALLFLLRGCFAGGAAAPTAHFIAAPPMPRSVEGVPSPRVYDRATDERDQSAQPPEGKRQKKPRPGALPNGQ